MSTALMVLIGYSVFKMSTDANIKQVVLWLILLLWWVITYYMVAPTAEQITRIIQSARVLKLDATEETANAINTSPIGETDPNLQGEVDR